MDFSQLITELDKQLKLINSSTFYKVTNEPFRHVAKMIVHYPTGLAEKIDEHMASRKYYPVKPDNFMVIASDYELYCDEDKLAEFHEKVSDLLEKRETLLALQSAIKSSLYFAKRIACEKFESNVFSAPGGELIRVTKKGNFKNLGKLYPHKN